MDVNIKEKKKMGKFLKMQLHMPLKFIVIKIKFIAVSGLIKEMKNDHKVILCNTF